MSFWNNQAKIPIGQQPISIMAENEQDYNPGQKVVILVPKDVGFFLPSETYLKCELEIENEVATGTNALMQLNPELGGQALIRDIKILSGTGTLLEEISGYNTLVQLMYDYDTNNNIKRKRTITEGCTTTPSQIKSNSIGQLYENPDRDNVLDNPAFKLNSTGASTTRRIHMCLPLHTGILSNTKIFPASQS